MRYDFTTLALFLISVALVMMTVFAACQHQVGMVLFYSVCQLISAYASGMRLSDIQAVRRMDDLIRKQK